MTALTARQIIKREYGDAKNFMTPDVIAYRKITTTIAAEIASGWGMNNNRIYGVSVARYFPETDTTERLYDYNTCFATLQDAYDHIEHLKNTLWTLE